MARRQARAAEERRTRRAALGRRIAWALPVAAVGAALVWVGIWMARPETLPVRVVRLVGHPSHLDPEALRAVIRPLVAKGFLRVDVAGVQQALEALPWVDRCSVRRLWPDRIEVAVTEQTALARWSAGGLINPGGERFAAEAAEWPQPLPELSGPEGTNLLVANRYKRFRQILGPVGLPIAGVAMDARRAWRVRLEDGIEILLGRSDHERRLERFVHVYPKALASRAAAIVRVDLRYTNGFAVAWRDGRAPGAG